uniref:Putative secreted protein n=1 Tax=Ixodes ricinus TaxID=34613 RepID=A0A6B0UG73_IXORI
MSWSSALYSSLLGWPTCNGLWQSISICSSHLQWLLHLPSAMALCCHCFPSANDHYKSLCSGHLHSLSAASNCKDPVHLLPPLSISDGRLKLCNHHHAHST